jgi:hypothetical protein
MRCKFSISVHFAIKEAITQVHEIHLLTFHSLLDTHDCFLLMSPIVYEVVEFEFVTYSFIFDKFQMLLVPLTKQILLVETRMKMEESKMD